MDALIVMDYINEIVHPEGKFKGKGYASFCKENNVLENVAEAVRKMRDENAKIVYVKVGFSPDYSDQPKNSVLFGKAHEFKALARGTWATEFHEALDVKKDDFVVEKKRVSPFYNTDLDEYLKKNKVIDVYLAGVATDLVVQSAARDAHDRDYNVYVLKDCCAAGSAEDHENALKNMEKFARIAALKDLP